LRHRRLLEQLPVIAFPYRPKIARLPCRGHTAIVEARFTYLGSLAMKPVSAPVNCAASWPQASAQDACNLVYAMWRIEPNPNWSSPSKPIQAAHSRRCANRGYKNIKPARSKPVPVRIQKTTHFARNARSDLRVWSDNNVVWR